MSILSSIESEFSAIMGDARSITEKIEAVVALHGKTQALQAIEPQIAAVLENASIATADKVEQILKMVGKL